MSRPPPAVVRALLDPEAGLVRAHQMMRHPKPPHLYLMVADIGTRFGGTLAPTVHDVTGAYDLTVDGAAVRGLGEAVERFALLRQPDDPLAIVRASRADLHSLGTDAVSPDGWPGYHHPATAEEAAWYAATELPSGRQVFVPVSWVDCPDGDEDSGWEGTPSGAAAHTSLEAATRTAVNELLERDALMTAWYRADRGHAIELDLNDACADDTPHGAAFRRLLTAQPAVTARVVRLRTALDGLHAHVAWVDDGTIVAAGASVALDGPTSALHSLREAWQIFFALSAHADLPPARSDAPAGSFFARSEARCRYWADGRGRDAFHEWASGLQADRLPPAEPSPDRDEIAIWETLADRGFQVLRVDLSDRLPPAVRDAGFVAVKVMVAGLQPLVLTEGEAWALVESRLGPTPMRDVEFQPLI